MRKRKHNSRLSPEIQAWLNTAVLISILPGTLLVIGMILWLSLIF